MTSISHTLNDIDGHIVLAGAGKMGGALLTGWIAGTGQHDVAVDVVERV